MNSQIVQYSWCIWLVLILVQVGHANSKGRAKTYDTAVPFGYGQQDLSLQSRNTCQNLWISHTRFICASTSHTGLQRPITVTVRRYSNKGQSTIHCFICYSSFQPCCNHISQSWKLQHHPFFKYPSVLLDSLVLFFFFFKKDVRQLLSLFLVKI